jgi:hypothetical protein
VVTVQKFPKNNDDKKDKNSKKVGANLFGNRFHKDETLYEFMIEFLLIFTSAKNASGEGEMRFHDFSKDETKFYFQPKMGLRRFIFYDKARKSDSVPDDKIAYDRMIEALKSRIEDSDDKDEIVNAIHDLFYGYSVILKKRAWCAQNVLPLCPEMVFCAANPNVAQRKKNGIKDGEPMYVIDKYFNFDKRNFLSRGGELYYLHILQGLKGDQEMTKRLEYLISNMIKNDQLSELINFICDVWYEESEANLDELRQALSIGYIPEDAYMDCEQFAVSELINFLSCNLNPIKRLEICAKGIMLQIMRMMSWREGNYLGKGPHRWLVCMRTCNSQVVKKKSAQDFSELEDEFQNAFNQMARELDTPEDKLVAEIHDAKVNSFDILKSKGKEMQCIIPPKGAIERFSLSEEVVTFLVLSIIEPEGKLTYDSFLEELYKHYRIVIRPKEYKESSRDNNDLGLASAFEENSEIFQELLRDTGFLRELSDATSIVENPYKKILEA